MLPKNYRGFPMLFSEHELSLLEGSQFQLAIREEVALYTHVYNSICQAIPEFKEFNLNDFLENLALVRSRIIGLKAEEQSK